MAFALALLAPAAALAQPLLTSASTYYRVRNDFRRCVSPLCGGYWVARANKKQTRCADGVYREECYVAEIDLAALDLPPDQETEVIGNLRAGRALLRGAIRPRVYGHFGNLGLFATTEAWLAATDTEPTGTWYRLDAIGSRGGVSGCTVQFSLGILEEKLNTAWRTIIQAVDLCATGATPEQIAHAHEVLASERLIAVGLNVTGPAPAVDSATIVPIRRGVRLAASQLYFKVVPRPVDPQACTADDECTFSLHPAPVTSPDECYCMTCPVPMNTTAAQQYAEQWATHCAEDWGFDRCPPPPCARPPGVGCVAGACSLVFDGFER